MAFYYVYPSPEIDNLTFLQSTFPEHHHLFGDTRHKIGQFFGSLGDDTPPIYNKPRADVRETADKYFIDIELPGLENREKLILKWTNTRFLMIEATIDRPPIVPVEERAKSESPITALPTAKDDTSNKPVEEKQETPVHMTVHERRVGKYLRTFSFPVDVDHHSVLAQLQHGLLRLVVTKLGEPVDHKEIIVEHAPTA